MKVSPLKLINQLLKKKVSFNPQKYISKKNFYFLGIIIILLAFFSYFLRPSYFDYNENKDIIQNKINQKFKLPTIIDGNISYSAFPYPTIKIENVRINFVKNKSNQIKVKEILVKIAPNKIGSINKLDFNKILIIKQSIKVNPSNLKQIFNFISSHKKGQIVLKNSKIIFEDDQKNVVNFENVNLQDKFTNNKHKIDTNLNFSNNKIKIKFQNPLDSEKKLKINIPNLKQNLEIKFSKDSTLNNLKGELKLNVFDSILLVNFKGKDNFKISKSYLRNKFLNSKIDGQVSFRDPFNFNINLAINHINIRKLFMSFPLLQTGKISKKINGAFNIDIKSAETSFGKIRNTKMNLNFENGDLRINNIKANLPFNSSINSNINLLLDSNKPKIDYQIKFFSQDPNKFLRRFGIYDFKQKNVTWFSEGMIDVKNKKIKIVKLLKDKVQMKNKNQIKLIEDSFNKNVINDSIIGIFDLFKFKKFLKEVN